MILSDKYDKKEYISEGTGGIVFKGIYKFKNENVAIKSIPLIYKKKDLYKRLYREISILKHLDSRFCLSLIDLYAKYENEELFEVYLILPLMDYDLRKITSDYNLVYKQIIQIIYQILMGLKYLYESGIIHRDLKPSNIGINKNLDLKILDFGLARDKQDDLTEYVVTRWYRPLEVFCTSQYTMAVDMWSAGCILAELFTKQVLFPGENQTDQSICILKIMGWPTDKMLNKMNNENTVSGLKLFQKYAAPSNELCHNIEKKINNFVCNDEKEDKQCSKDVMTLISQMLHLDPDERITPHQALNSPLFCRHESFIESYRETGIPKEFNCFGFQGNDNNNTEEFWKKEIINEINNYKQDN